MEEVVALLEKKKDLEHVDYLVGDICKVLEDRISECKSILKNGVIWKKNPYPSGKIAPCDYFWRDEVNG